MLPNILLRGVSGGPVLAGTLIFGLGEAVDNPQCVCFARERRAHDWVMHLFWGGGARTPAPICLCPTYWLALSARANLYWAARSLMAKRQCLERSGVPVILNFSRK